MNARGGHGLRVQAIEWAALHGRRPRPAGSNARLGAHGVDLTVPIARIVLDDGATGIGLARPERGAAEAVVGHPLGELFGEEAGSTPLGRPFDLPLWDLAARRRDLPVYALLAAAGGREAPVRLQVPVYDTSLYFDDLDLADDEEAAARIAAEAREGVARGHRHVKVKIGRGARHLPLQVGMRRDVAVVRAVRRAIGEDGALLVDANDGFNLNLAKWFLGETADCRLHWLEEAFNEDPVLYRELHDWSRAQGLQVAIADGETSRCPAVVEQWAEEGLVDVLQFDLLRHGISGWLRTLRRLTRPGVRIAPHHYGLHLGNYISGHLAAASGRFAFVEWDQATAEGVSAPGYEVAAGRLLIPARPGFGIDLDPEVFAAAVEQEGFSIRT